MFTFLVATENDVGTFETPSVLFVSQSVSHKNTHTHTVTKQSINTNTLQQPVSS